MKRGNFIRVINQLHSINSVYFIFVTVFVMMLGANTFAQSISLDSVSGYNKPPSILPTNSEITFYLRIANDIESHSSIANGFRIYSDDGATWTSTTADTIGTLGRLQFDFIFLINSFSMSGIGADTIGFSGSKFLTLGLPSNYNEVSYSIKIGPIPSSSDGKTICLDSSFYSPSGVWKWSQADVSPNWDGPHCFTICDGADSDSDGIPGNCDNCPNVHNPNQEDVNQNGIGDVCEECCVGLRGNANGDVQDIFDVSDLVFLVEYTFFNGVAPSCIEEADFDGSNVLDISDLVNFVAFVFLEGTDPSSCP